jgi:hypothetical protein
LAVGIGGANKSLDVEAARHEQRRKGESAR